MAKPVRLETASWVFVAGQPFGQVKLDRQRLHMGAQEINRTPRHGIYTGAGTSDEERAAATALIDQGAERHRPARDSPTPQIVAQ